ncbi:MAG: type IX secretion system sortase PorU [Saprospiraceae bacterium]|nr:type IX secretion system sortase PorU [Saprospiraceae bacterium]
MKNALLGLLFVAGAMHMLHAQSSISFTRNVEWAAGPSEFTQASGDVLRYWTFKGATFSDDAAGLPVFSERIPLSGRSTLSVETNSMQFESFAYAPLPGGLTPIEAEVQVQVSLEQERNKFFARVRFVPIRKTGSGYERVTGFSLNIRATPVPASVQERGGPYTYTSALNAGTLYKFGVAQSGIYKLDYAFLKNELGISNLDNLDPRTIRIYGNAAGMLPERNMDTRADDLTENAVLVVGESDGKFDQGDYILMYAVGPSPWTYRPGAVDPELTVRTNLYDNRGWYFVKTGDGNGLRMSEQTSVQASVVTETFDDFIRIEDDKVNLLDFSTSAQGAGKKWFGDYFYQTRERNYAFNFPNVVPGSVARVRAEFAGRSSVSTVVRLAAGAVTLSKTINGVDVSNNEASFAGLGVIQGSFQPTGDQFDVKIQYQETSQQSEGWLDYIEINARRRLTMSGSILEFRDLSSLAQAATTFRLSGASGNLTVWDISNPRLPFIQQKTQNGGTVEFGAVTTTLKSFIAFADNAVFPKPESVAGKVANQNIHALENLHMAIIYHPDFEAQAQQLAEHRRSFSNLNVATVNIFQLYNEFSSGAKDPVAIRDFARMLYDRNPDKFEYLLLLGDGSFDPRNVTNSTANRDYIPVFETPESFSPITSYPSDDFFALLNDNEGGNLSGALDIAVGRLTVDAPSEAQVVVDKIMAYDQSPSTLGDWHLRTTFLADDEDSNVHLNQAEDLANATAATESWFNVDKIYFDAYQQVATSGGQRYPDAQAAVNSEVFKGALLLQYIGHGGPRGLAQERVVTNNDIAGWENPGRYPLIVTATCSFGGYDDYSLVTGGEQALLKPNSGAIALFTTVRAVFIGGNNILTDAVQRFIFKRVNGQYRSIGDILKDAKNSLTSDQDNARRFTLLGDPAMFLAMPEYRVATTKINGHEVVAGQPDTLKALMPVKIEGVVTDTLGSLLSSFNGRVYVSVFDKVQTLRTLVQDPTSGYEEFQVQRNILFKGIATVTGGRFAIEFVVPKDIEYNYGPAKISYYAENGSPLDAAGADKNIVIGGNANQIQDDKAPVVTPYLNTDAFVSGGITDNNPKVLVKCSDDHGMNVSATGLGHDLTAVLDGNVLETIVLNDFYVSEQDNYRRGQAIFPLRNLTTGRHTLQVKGWDVANNPGEGYTEFVVAEDGKAAIDHVLNYPNPFTTNTYFQFEHNLAGQVLDVQISIFTVSGKLVKTIQHASNPDGFRVTDIQWNGLDDYGDRLARGVYLYRVKVRGTDLSGSSVTAESEFEKLVILK